MTLHYKICLFAVMLFDFQDIKWDRAELLSLSIFHIFEVSTRVSTGGSR